MENDNIIKLVIPIDPDTGTEYTPEEIAEMAELNESFVGTRANMEKVRLYREIKDDLLKFKKLCPGVEIVDGFDPNIHEKHAVLWADFSPAVILQKPEADALAAIMEKADALVLACVDGHIRISFDIRDIWAD